MPAELVAQIVPAEPFPNGISRYAIGSLLVGLGAVVIYLGTGIAVGTSTFLESTLSYVSDQSRFLQYRASQDWRVVFTLWIILEAAVYAVFWQGGAWTTDVPYFRTLVESATILLFATAAVASLFI